MRDDGLTGVQESIIKNSEETWTISGTPTTAQPATTVTLEAKNKQGEPVSPVTTEFKWTVNAAPAPPKFTKPTNTAGNAIKHLVLTGNSTNQRTPAIKPLAVE